VVPASKKTAAEHGCKFSAPPFALPGPTGPQNPLPARRSQLRWERLVEAVRMVGGHFAGAVVSHDRQLVVMLVVIGAGAVER
jgi:hypothetical protein